MATTTVEPSGSADPGPSGSRFGEASLGEVGAHLGIARHDGGPADLLQYPGNGLRPGRGLGRELLAADRGAAPRGLWRWAVPGQDEGQPAGTANEQNDGEERGRPPAPPDVTAAAARALPCPVPVAPRARACDCAAAARALRLRCCR